MPRLKSRRYGLILSILIGALLLTSPMSLASMPLNATYIPSASLLTPIAQLGRGYVTKITWSPDGKTLAVATSTGVWLYDATDFKKPPIHIPGYSAGVWFSPDSRHFANNNGDYIQFYDMATLQPTGRLSNGGVAAAFSADWSVLFTSKDNETKLWRVVDQQPVPALDIHYINDNAEIDFNPAGTQLAYSHEISAPSILDVVTGKTRLELQGGSDASSIRSLAFSPDGSVLVAGSGVFEGSDAGDPNAGNDVQAWNVTTGQLIFDVRDHDQAVGGVAFSPDGTMIASGSNDDTVRLRDPHTGLPRLTLSGGKYLAFSPDSTRLATNNRTDGTIRVYNVVTGATIASLRTFGNLYLWGSADPLPFQIAFSPDSSQLAVVNYAQNIQLWDIKAATSVNIDLGAGVNDFEFGPDGRQIMTISGNSPNGDNPNIARLWDARSGELLNETNADYPVGMVFTQGYARIVRLRYTNQVIVQDMQTNFISAYVDIEKVKPENTAISGDGKVFAAFYPTSGTIQLWNLETGHLLHSLASQLSDPLTTFQFSPDGNLLMISDINSDQIQIWRVATGQRLFTWNEDAFRPVFSPDSQWVYTEANIWSTVTGASVSKPTYSDVEAFSPDSSLLAWGEGEGDPGIPSARRGIVHVVNTGTRDTLATIKVDTDYIIGVTFSPDGRLLAAVGLDGVIHLWAVSSTF